MTPCLDCGRPCAGPRCPAHQRAHKAKYRDHPRLRAQWAPLIAQGQVHCWRCVERGEEPSVSLIVPGTPWDLGHRPGRDEVQHPEHARCNRSAK